MAYEQVVSSEPNCKIGIFGDDENGKINLVDAIRKSLEGFGRLPRSNRMEFTGKSRVYASTIVPCDNLYENRLKNGSMMFDGIILHVDNAKGLNSQVCEQITKSYEYGITHLIVFVDNCKLVNGVLQVDSLVERNIQKFLSTTKFKRERTLCFPTSSSLALAGNKDAQNTIRDLVDWCDREFPSSKKTVVQSDSTSKIDDALGNISAKYPLTLFPIRLETSFCKLGSKKQLRVRIIPDEIMLDYKANSKLTDAEIKDGKFFWIQWYIASGCERREYEAWENLCSKYPLYKAARICRELKPVDFNEDKFKHRRPYVNSANKGFVGNVGSDEEIQGGSNIEFIESKCQTIYDLLSEIIFDESKYLTEKDKDVETSFENDVRKNLSQINGFVFEIESLLLSCDKIVDYLYDNVHETFLYLQRRLQALYSIYQKLSCLSTPRSLEIWDIDYSILKSLLEKTELFLKSLENRRIALADMVELYLQEKDKFKFPGVESTKSDDFIVPVCKCLPSQFVFVGESVAKNKEKKVIIELSKKVDASKIQMSFTKPSADGVSNPNDGLDDNGELSLPDNPNMKWMTDYDTAEKYGMAITIDIDSNVDEFNYIYVFGVNSSSNDNIRKSVISDLIYGHNYVNSNVRIVNAGTPTNQIDEQFKDEDEFLKRARYEIEVKEIYNKSSQYPEEGYCDAMKIACLLNGSNGGFSNIWGHVVGFESAQDYYAEIAYGALWDKYLGSDVFKGNFIRDFFVKHVRARGNFATIRMDNLPYGILPTSDFVQMCEFLQRRNGNKDLKNLVYSLIQLADKWKACRNKNVKCSENIDGSDAQQKYLEMAGQTPYSVSFTVRYLLDSCFNPSYLDADANENIRDLSIIGNFLKEENLRAIPVANVYNIHENKDSGLLSDMKNTILQAWETKELSTDSCNRDADLYVSEFLDLLTYRLDAWFMGILDYCFCEKIKAVKSPYVGAFGWVFNLQDKHRTEISGNEKTNLLKKMEIQEAGKIYESPQDGHFILAPSIQHALTASVLRSSYIKSNAQKRSDSQICVNLSSARVRQALRLVDGVRSGMSLSVILGSDFERYLHDAHNIYKRKVKDEKGNVVKDEWGKDVEVAVEMDEFIYPLRQLFPQVVELEAGDKRANDYVMQVVNGEALLNSFIKEWAWAKPVSEWLLEAWNKRNNENEHCLLIDTLKVCVENNDNACWLDESKFDVLFKIIERLMDSYDALNDLLVSEGVHRLIMGDRASYNAISKFLAGNIDGNLPEPDILNIPSEHVVVAHKAGVLLPHRLNQIPNKVMCNAEPALNEWIEQQFGGMENILFFIQKSENGKSKTLTCSLADLDISGVEYVYLSAFEKTFRSYLEARICTSSKKKFTDFIKSRSEEFSFFESAVDAGIKCPDAKISLEDNKLRLESIRGLIARARSMNSSDWCHNLCEDKPEDSLIDLDDLKIRLSNAISLLGIVKGNVKKWLDDAPVEIILEDSQVKEAYSLLCDCYESGLINCLVQYDNTAFIGEITQTSNVLEYNRVDLIQQNLREEMQKVYKNLTERIDEAQRRIGEASCAEDFVSALQSVTLSNFKICYKFNTALGENATAISPMSLASYTNIGSETVFDKWQDEVSEVREGMKIMQQFSMTQLALDRDLEPVSILQSTISDDGTHVDTTFEKWLGAEVENESDLRDADSLILYNSSEYSKYSKYYSGFVFDSWIEYIPYKKHDAGLAFHSDWPNAEAPQGILVAWHPSLPVVPNDEKTYCDSWDVKTLLNVVRSTHEMMMNRAVEPDYIYQDPLLSKILPLRLKK